MYIIAETLIEIVHKNIYLLHVSVWPQDDPEILDNINTDSFSTFRSLVLIALFTCTSSVCFE